MSEKLNALQEKRLTLAKQLHDHADNQAKWTAEDNAKWDTLNAAYDANKAELDAEVATIQKENAQRQAITDRLAAIDGHQDYNPGRPRFGRDGGDLADGPTSGMFSADNAKFAQAQALALQAWMMAGDEDLHGRITENHLAAAKTLGVNLRGGKIKLRMGVNSAEASANYAAKQRYYVGGARTARNGDLLNGRDLRNDMLAAKGVTGGFMIGETMMDRFETALLDYSGTMQVAEIIRTDSGETMPWPFVDDTANKGSRVGEAIDMGVASSVDPKVGRLVLQSFIYNSGFLNVSRAWLTDSPYALEGAFGEMLGVRIGRKFNDDFTTGADVGNGPIGIVTAATSGVTTASSTAILYDEILDLIYSVDPALRRQAVGVGFLLHDSIAKVIRKLKDGIGDYLWQPSQQAGEPDLLAGFPHYLNQSMDSTVASGKKTILFGWLRRYKVRMVNEVVVERLKERRAEFYEDAFIATVRADGGLLDPNDRPVKYMTH